MYGGEVFGFHCCTRTQMRSHPTWESWIGENPRQRKKKTVAGESKCSWSGQTLKMKWALWRKKCQSLGLNCEKCSILSSNWSNIVSSTFSPAILRAFRQFPFLLVNRQQRIILEHLESARMRSEQDGREQRSMPMHCRWLSARNSEDNMCITQ